MEMVPLTPPGQVPAESKEQADKSRTHIQGVNTVLEGCPANNLAMLFTNPSIMSLFPSFLLLPSPLSLVFFLPSSYLYLLHFPLHSLLALLPTFSLLPTNSSLLPHVALFAGTNNSTESSLTTPTFTIYSSPQRQTAIELCGWSFSKSPEALEEFFKW